MAAPGAMDMGLKPESGVVVILDALGSKGIWRTADLATVVDKRDEFYSSLIDLLRPLLKEALPGILSAAKVEDRHVSDGEWRAQVFSDTIIVTASSRDAFPEDLLFGAYFVSSLALYLGVLTGVALHRGAISVGEFCRGKVSLLGPAVDEAAIWFEQADWMGVLLTPSAREAAMRLSRRLGYPLDTWFPVAPIPMAHGPRWEDGRAVDWPSFASNPANQKRHATASSFFSELLPSMFLKPPVSPDLVLKYDNTTRFIRQVLPQYSKLMGPGPKPRSRAPVGSK